MKIIDYDALKNAINADLADARKNLYQHDYVARRDEYKRIEEMIERLAYDSAPVTRKMQKAVRTCPNPPFSGCSQLNEALEDGWTVIGNTILSRSGETIVEYILEKEVVVSEGLAGAKNGDTLSKRK